MLQFFLLILSLYHIYQINKLEYAQDWLFNLNIANMFLVLLNIMQETCLKWRKRLSSKAVSGLIFSVQLLSYLPMHVK